jgi:hypothetical protein
MEILPEATLKLGLLLQSHTLARAGFAILVSEEALRIGGGKYFKKVPIKNKEDRQAQKDVTRFGRAREDLDEDTQNIIQHAGRNFSSRVEKVLGDLIEQDVHWLDKLPQFSKLLVFQELLNSMKESGKSSAYLLMTQREGVNTLISLLRHYVRGRVVYCLIDNLSYSQAKDGTNHRIAERWKSLEAHSGGASFVHDFVYNMLSDHERMLTRGFWQMMRDLEWTTDQYSNHIRDNMVEVNTYHNKNLQVAEAYGIEYVNMRHIESRVNDVNTAMRETSRQPVFTGGHSGPASSTFGSATAGPSIVNDTTEQLSGVKSEITDDSMDDWYIAERAVMADLKGEIINKSLDDWYLAERTIKMRSEGTRDEWKQWITSAISDDLYDGPPRFSLPKFLTQVQRHIRDVCNSMLEKKENDWAVLCDTLLCLTDEEYKYLPLWAGGMDDGSGGVFEEEIPPAEKGPIGPGPSFHTGSTANSMADSELDFDAASSVFGSNTMEGIQTSLGVEDGFTDHLDRRVVYSEEDFPMEHGPLPVHTRVEQAAVSTSASATDAVNAQETREQTASSSHIDSADFFNVQDDEEGDFDMEDSGSEGTLTERE